MPKIKVKDIDIYYEIYGEGYPIIMIQGLSANTDWWTKELLESLEEDFKLIIFDNRGAGKTENTNRDFSIKMLADDTLALMDALKINHFHIFGVSMGGMIAQELVINYPEKIEKLILGCTHCGGSKQILPSQEVLYILNRDHKKISPEKLIEGTIPLLFTEDFIKNNHEFIESYRQKLLKSPMSPESFHRQINAISRFNNYLKLEKITCPTLIIHGKKDVLVPYENADILNKRIKNSKLILMNEAAHSFFQPKPEIVIKEIKDFLK
jgi:pimeloyl-ACP methyl ester carboxylesterase